MRAGQRLASPVERYLTALHARLVGLEDGEVATYIPELAKADPRWWAICVATTDGHVYEVGDSRQLFTIQSISKPFTYGLALEDRGVEAVLTKVGVEPSGEAFNSIRLEAGTGRPLNPMVNAGAIATAALVAGRSPADRLARLLGVFSTYAGRPLAVDEAVYRSEAETGHRNRAIAHLLRNFDVIGSDPDGALDLYFRQCSIAVDCRDLAVMAATLASGGVNPRTGERALRTDLIESVLSVMTTCGMYDGAGEWVYTVGLPAKSGVAGGILAVAPGQLGIGLFSPRLDARGNSVRGVAACRALAADLGLHFLHAPRAAQAAVRAHYSLATTGSKRLREEGERALLDVHGAGVRVYELQGDVGFAALEAMVRRIVDASPAAEAVIVDILRVTRVERGAARLFYQLVVELGARDAPLGLVGVHLHSAFLRSLEEELAARDEWSRLVTFTDLDAALEWGENQVLAARNGRGHPAAVPLAEHQLCRGLDPAALGRVETILQPRRFRAGEFIVRKGDPADALYLLARGRVSVTAEGPDGRVTRLSTVSPGMVFGELAVIDGSPRTADVRADTVVECWALPAAELDRLGEAHPEVKMQLLERLLRSVHRMVSRLDEELAARMR
jgi:glutaminase